MSMVLSFKNYIYCRITTSVLYFTKLQLFMHVLVEGRGQLGEAGVLLLPCEFLG